MSERDDWLEFEKGLGDQAAMCDDELGKKLARKGKWNSDTKDPD